MMMRQGGAVSWKNFTKRISRLRFLRIGDPHVKPSNLEESHKIMGMACELATRHGANRIEILGDLFHTHAIVRLEVLEFWKHWFDILTELHFNDGIETVVLVGNHDMSGDRYSAGHAMRVFPATKYSPKIIDRPTTLGIYGYLPFRHNREDFIVDVQQLASSGAKTLVCHQSITGCTFENGYYDPHGIDPGDIPFSLVISGHIHKWQTFSSGEKTIIYPGTPRWDSASDANERKGLSLYEHDEITGAIVSTEFFSTAKVCRPIINLIWQQGELITPIPSGNIQAHIELIGTSAWVKEQKELLKGSSASIKATITDARLVRMKTGTNLEKFLHEIYQTTVDKNELLTYMRSEELV
jgi:predicted phosphodiesterase